MLDHHSYQGTLGGTRKNQNDHADDTMTGDELKEHKTKVIKEDFIDDHVIEVGHYSTLGKSKIINIAKCIHA